jgi:hypothetical protein
MLFAISHSLKPLPFNLNFNRSGNAGPENTVKSHGRDDIKKFRAINNRHKRQTELEICVLNRCPLIRSVGIGCPVGIADCPKIQWIQ